MWLRINELHTQGKITKNEVHVINMARQVPGVVDIFVKENDLEYITIGFGAVLGVAH